VTARPPSWLAIGASVVLMSAGAACDTIAARHDEPLLDLVAAALLVLGVLTVRISIRHTPRRPAPTVPGSRAATRQERLEGAEAFDMRGSVVVATDGGGASDAALRTATAEAERRQTTLLVVISYRRPIDPDLDDIETPVAELETRARELASRALCRALSLPAERLPLHRIVTEHRELTHVLLRSFGDAALIVVASDHRLALRHLTGGYVSAGRLARRSRAPVVIVPPSS
jgi:nucleotide-binding universal stress UspA family protein